MVSTRLRVALWTTAALVAVPSCRCGGPEEGVGHEAADAAGAATSEADGEALPAPPLVLEAGIDDACRATRDRPVDLGDAITDPRCAVRSSEAKALLAALSDGGVSLHQTATLLPGGVVEVRIENTGPAALTLPLSWHTKISAFSALAEAADHTLYELDAPRFTPLRADGRVHFAHIVVAAGAAAFARVVPATTIVRRVLPPCDAGSGANPTADAGDASPCAPARLPPGPYVLHVGELVVDVEAGAPASVAFPVSAALP